jgi:thymidylate synthase (FAD)
MRVKLASYTRPADDIVAEGIETVQDLVAYCARVSNPTNQFNTETADKLIQYLIKHKHWSPFEMASVCLEVETTRDIGRQMLRHRSFSFQEFSGRYSRADQMGFVLREARLQDQKNRQNSLETEDEALTREWESRQRRTWDEAVGHYQWAIDNGIAKEVARAVLPEGMTPSRMYVNGTLRSWIHYLEVRLDPSTQKEHRLVAKACAEAIVACFPLINTSLSRENTTSTS